MQFEVRSLSLRSANGGEAGGWVLLTSNLSEGVLWTNQEPQTRNLKLFDQPCGIGGKDFYRNGEQYYAKKFSYSDQSGRSQ